MFSRILPLLLILPLIHAQGVAQDAPPRVVELRVVALSRGYMRPMGATAERIGALPGIESIEMLGFGGDTARYRVTTKLSDDALAETLQLSILGRGTDQLTLSNDDNRRAQRAEARGVVTQIGLAISRLPSPDWDPQPVFADDMSLPERMRHLDLNPALLNGAFYKARDYHIEEAVSSSSITYKVWAGDRDESVFVPSGDRWFDEEEDHSGAEPSDDSRFVGIHIYRSAWSNSMNWVDAEGLALEGHTVSRGDTDGDGVLHVQHGAQWMTEILEAVAAILVREPKTPLNRLPAGRGAGFINRLEKEGVQINRWVNHYDRGGLQLKWREDDGSKIAVLRAHNPRHPFYLEAEVDTTQVVDDYRLREETESLDLSEVLSAELGDAITWIFGAEESVDVFAARQREAEAGVGALIDALKQASGQHALAELCGRLDDEALMQRLGFEGAFESFSPADYTLTAQMLGDVEIGVGSAPTGGRYWMLVNAATGEVVRGNLRSTR